MNEQWTSSHVRPSTRLCVARTASLAVTEAAGEDFWHFFTLVDLFGNAVTFAALDPTFPSL